MICPSFRKHTALFRAMILEAEKWWNYYDVLSKKFKPFFVSFMRKIKIQADGKWLFKRKDQFLSTVGVSNFLTELPSIQNTEQCETNESVEQLISYIMVVNTHMPLQDILTRGRIQGDWPLCNQMHSNRKAYKTWILLCASCRTDSNTPDCTLLCR